jgi:hypothetical protein
MSSKRNYKRKSLKKGGAGAANHAIAVYGDMGQQHAVSNSNVIATKVGGAEKETEVSGGNILTDIAVPAILITSRELYKGRTRKSNKKSKGKRYSVKSRRQSRRR